MSDLKVRLPKGERARGLARRSEDRRYVGHMQDSVP
jgi:hypothetical protein